MYMPIWDEISADVPIRMIKHNEDESKTPGITRVPSIFLLDEYGRRTQYRGPPRRDALRRFLLAPYPIVS